MTAEAPPEFDRAAEMRSDLGFLEAQLDAPTTLFLPLHRGQIFTRASAGSTGAAELVLLTRAEVGARLDDVAEIIWLGRYRGSACFALDLGQAVPPERVAALSGATASELRGMLAQLPPGLTELTLLARALVYWHERHRFCSVCGQPSRPRQGGYLRVCTQQECHAEHFPRTDPCVLVLVRDGDRCLLGRSRGWPPGMYSALAGFVEPGESLEGAVAREVKEEVGIDIEGSTLRYAGSQPWPFPASLMVGFVAQARTFDIKIDEQELEAARWVTREQLQRPQDHGFFVPPRFAIAGQLIAQFADGTLDSSST
jgi:NAD+ diphosphatase